MCRSSIDSDVLIVRRPVFERIVERVTDQCHHPRVVRFRAVVTLNQRVLAAHQHWKKNIGRRKGLQVRLGNWPQGRANSVLEQSFAPHLAFACSECFRFTARQVVRNRTGLPHVVRTNDPSATSAGAALPVMLSASSCSATENLPRAAATLPL